MRDVRDGADPDQDPEGRTTPAPWERMPGEPDEAWRLFSRFALSEAPSVARFAREDVDGRSNASIQALAARWRWRARRDALTWHLHREAVAGAAEEARAQGAAHARATAMGLDWAVESITERRSRGEMLEPREALAFLKATIELQRLASGEPTARVGVDLTHATDADLANIRAALAAALEPKRVEAVEEKSEPDPN